jgi:DNA-binding CsgD family transcriptional regulator
MAITRTDETELLPPLHDGMHETPLWATFLDRLRRRTGASYVAMIFREAGVAMHMAAQFYSGRNIRAAAMPLGDLRGLDPIPYDRLRPGRVYSADELVDPQDSRSARFRAEYLEPIGVRHGRFMRVVEDGGTSLWTILAHDGADFTAADSALLAALAPHLTIALRSFAVLERARFRALAAEEALRRAGIDLRPADAPADAMRIAAPPGLSGAIATPATIDLARRPPVLGPAHAAAFAQAHRLTPGEARLALLLADGHSLADSAQALGLTIETARNYSKRLFLKTGTTGQVQLVRLVLTSAAILA